MNLNAMRFKSYQWPYNPRTYSIQYERKMAAHKVPFGGYCLQDLGLVCRVMRGEGEFAGADAYEEFQKLASVFYDSGPGELIHPVWQSARVHFVELALSQEPRADYVRYTFTFWEESPGGQAGLKAVTATDETASAPKPGGMAVHTVAQGETLWGIARLYGLALSELIARNPQIKNPNLIVVGEQVRVAK